MGSRRGDQTGYECGRGKLFALLVTPVQSCKQGIYHSDTLWLLSTEKTRQVARGVLYCLDNWGGIWTQNPFIFEDSIPPFENGNLLFPMSLWFELKGSPITLTICVWILCSLAFMSDTRTYCGSLRPCTLLAKSTGDSTSKDSLVSLCPLTAQGSSGNTKITDP